MPTARSVSPEGRPRPIDMLHRVDWGRSCDERYIGTRSIVNRINSTGDLKVAARILVAFVAQPSAKGGPMARLERWNARSR